MRQQMSFKESLKKRIDVMGSNDGTAQMLHEPCGRL
jgi:hypothetical protein